MGESSMGGKVLEWHYTVGGPWQQSSLSGEGEVISYRGNPHLVDSSVTKETSRMAHPLTAPLERIVSSWGLGQVCRKVSHVSEMQEKRGQVEQGRQREQEDSRPGRPDHCCCCSVAHRVWLFATPWTAAHQASWSITSSQFELAQTHVHWVRMPSNHLILCRPLLLLPSIFPSIRIFSSESVLHITWPKYWSLNEYPGLIFFRIYWFDLLAGQRTLKSLLQHHSSKALTLQHSGFFMVQLSYPYMTTGKTIALTR